jgi:hypothetical protein
VTVSVLAAGALWFAAIGVLVVAAGIVARRRGRARRAADDEAGPADQARPTHHG